MSETNLSAAPEQSAPAAAPEAAAPHEATEETVTVGALRGAIERRNAQRARRAAEEAAVRWSREADELTAQCPDFDLGAALNDARFCALLRAGIDVRPDVSRMSRADRAELAARAERGERVKLSL